MGKCIGVKVKIVIDTVAKLSESRHKNFISSKVGYRSKQTLSNYLDNQLLS